MELLLARIFDGLANGAIYAIVALAVVLIYKSTTLINFAQAEMAMFGAFIAYTAWFNWGIPMWGAVVLAVILSGLGAALIERVFVRPFDPADHLPLVIITLGLFLAINSMAGIIWKLDPLRFPELFPSGNAIEIGAARLSWYTVCTLISLIVILVGITQLLNRTRVGLAFRAVSSNLQSSELVGIPIGRTLQFGWAIAAAVGTLAACIFAANPVLSIEPSFMLRVLIFATAAAALGGLDSLWGALAGGITVGLVQSVVVQYLSFIPNQMSLGAAVVVLILVLVFRPSGFFGTVSVERV